MLHKTKGIVLHTIKFTETSIITKIYTESFGLQSYIVNGIRTARGKASFFSPLSILELEIYRRENKDLQRLKEFRPAYIYRSLGSDILKSAQCLFIAEVLYKAIREEEANEALFRFLEERLIALDSCAQASGNFHLTFLLDLAGYLGFSPDTNGSGTMDCFDLQEGKFTGEMTTHPHVISGRHAGLLFRMMSDEGETRMTLADRNFILEKILIYYKLHLPGFREVASPRVLHEVLENYAVAENSPSA